MGVRKPRSIAYGAVLCGALGVTGCGGPPAQKPPAGPPDVMVATPIKRPIVEWDEYVGRIEAIESVEIRARVSGYLVSTHYNEGELVKAGDLLCVIDPKPYAAEVALASAQMLEAQAHVAQAKGELAAAEAARRSAHSRMDLASKQSGRTEKLLQKGGTAVADFDVKQTEVLTTKAAVEESGAKIQAATAAIVTAEAVVKTAKSRLDIAELNLSYTRVLAPISGRVGRRAVTEGNLISGGTATSTLLTTIVSLDPIHCYFDCAEASFLKYVRLARSGERRSSRDVRNPVYLALADEGNVYRRQGYVDFVDNRLDPNTGTMRGRAIFANSDYTLTPGLFGRARLPGSGSYTAVLLPDKAIGTDQAEKFVFVVARDDTIRRQVVEIGPMSHGLRIIRKGLDGTERIVMRGLQRVRPGGKVKPVLEPIPPPPDDGLPDHYVPVPPEKWLRQPRSAEAGLPVEKEKVVHPPAKAGHDR